MHSEKYGRTQTEESDAEEIADMGQPNLRESKRTDEGGTPLGAGVALSESTDSVELAGAAEKAAATKPDCPRCWCPGCGASCERM